MSVTKVDLHREQKAHAETLAKLESALAENAKLRGDMASVEKDRRKMQAMERDLEAARLRIAGLMMDNAELSKFKPMFEAATDALREAEAMAVTLKKDAAKAEREAEMAKDRAAELRAEVKAERAAAQRASHQKPEPPEPREVVREVQVPRREDAATIAAQAARIDMLERELRAAGVEVPK